MGTGSNVLLVEGGSNKALGVQGVTSKGQIFFIIIRTYKTTFFAIYNKKKSVSTSYRRLLIIFSVDNEAGSDGSATDPQAAQLWSRNCYTYHISNTVLSQRIHL